MNDGTRPTAEIFLAPLISGTIVAASIIESHLVIRSWSVGVCLSVKVAALSVGFSGRPVPRPKWRKCGHENSFIRDAARGWGRS